MIQGINRMNDHESTRYYVVEKQALPDILLKVVAVKRMLSTTPGMTIQEAAREADISRSSFYKYKDSIFPFHDNVRGKTVTFLMVMDDIPGILAEILQKVAMCHASILTIHQTIPINGIATLTLSVDILAESCDVNGMMEAIEQLDGIHQLKILGKE